MPDPEPYEPAEPERQRAGRPPGGDRDASPASGSSASSSTSTTSRRATTSAGSRRRCWRSSRARPRSRDGREPAPDDVVAQGETAAEKFLLRWRGEADPDHVEGDRHVLDLHGRARAERVDLHRAVVASTGADCGAAMSSAVGALSGPLHGGAPARVLPMLDEVAADRATPSAYVRDCSTRGERIMGFGHRVYRAEDPRARMLQADGQELGSPQVEVAEPLEEVALAALQERQPDACWRRTSSSTRRSCSTSPRSRRPLTPAMFACSRVAGWSAHIIEQKRTGRLFRPSAALRRPPAPRSLSAV